MSQRVGHGWATERSTVLAGLETAQPQVQSSEELRRDTTPRCQCPIYTGFTLSPPHFKARSIKPMDVITDLWVRYHRYHFTMLFSLSNYLIILNWRANLEREVEAGWKGKTAAPRASDCKCRVCHLLQDEDLGWNVGETPQEVWLGGRGFAMGAASASEKSWTNPEIPASGRGRDNPGSQPKLSTRLRFSLFSCLKMHCD